MVSPADQGTIVIEKIVCYLRVSKSWEHTMSGRATRGKHQGWSGMLTSAREHS